MSAGALYSPRLVVVSKASAHAVPGHSAFLPRHRTTRFEQLNDSNLTTTAQSRSCFGEKMQFLIRSCNGLLPQEPAKHFLEHIQHMLSLMLLFWRPTHGIAQWWHNVRNTLRGMDKSIFCCESTKANMSSRTTHKIRFKTIPNVSVPVCHKFRALMFFLAIIGKLGALWKRHLLRLKNMFCLDWFIFGEKHMCNFWFLTPTAKK